MSVHTVRFGPVFRNFDIVLGKVTREPEEGEEKGLKPANCFLCEEPLSGPVYLCGECASCMHYDCAIQIRPIQGVRPCPFCRATMSDLPQPIATVATARSADRAIDTQPADEMSQIQGLARAARLRREAAAAEERQREQAGIRASRMANQHYLHSSLQQSAQGPQPIGERRVETTQNDVDSSMRAFRAAREAARIEDARPLSQRLEEERRSRDNM